MAPKNSAATKTESENADLKVHVLKVSEIDATSYKNSRSGNWHEGTGGLEDNDFEGLCASISSRGQDEPVTVRPHGKKMQLIAGFRRFAAHKKLGLATIKAFVRELDDNEARALNIRENTARNNLSGPDLAWAIWELHQGYTAKRMPVTAVAIAQEIGRNQAYVNTLLNIMRDVDPKITAHWREAEKQLPVKQMNKLIELKDDKVKQRDEYEKIYKSVTSTPDTANRSLEGLKSRAVAIATHLGDLSRLGLISVTGLDWVTNLPQLVRMPKDEVPAAELRAIAHAARGAYVERLEYVEPPPADPANAGTNGKGGKKKGGKGAEPAVAASAPS